MGKAPTEFRELVEIPPFDSRSKYILDALIYCGERKVPLNLNADYDYLDNVLYTYIWVYI